MKYNFNRFIDLFLLIVWSLYSIILFYSYCAGLIITPSWLLVFCPLLTLILFLVVKILTDDYDNGDEE